MCLSDIIVLNTVLKFIATIPDFVPAILTWVCIVSLYLFTFTTYTMIEGLRFPCN